ncbi:MAG: ABC transporter substrate-binding protein [Gammaproteobacteria bacterium]|nr:ABC transporter substrate-binding protein [Gammaproteobacteria bacterium]
MIKPLMLCCGLLTGLIVTTAAQAAQNAAAESPQQTLKTAVERMQDLIRQHHDAYKADPEQFYQVVNDVVVPHFDVPFISRLVLAKYWRTATPAQRSAFQSSFTSMLIHTYADAMLDNYDSAKVQWQPSRRVTADATRTQVDSVLARDNGEKYQVSFSMRRVDGQWKIYDVIIDNLSLVLNFRSQITSQVKRVGLDATIAKMQRGELIEKNGSSSS